LLIEEFWFQASAEKDEKEAKRVLRRFNERKATPPAGKKP
jgi:hypothetical protein